MATLRIDPFGVVGKVLLYVYIYSQDFMFDNI